jgi:protein TonB
VKPAPPPPPPTAPEKPKPVEQPKPQPEVVQPKPQPPPPPPPDPPKPKGPTKDAEAEDTVNPEIPDDLKHTQFKSFVRVRVEIDEDGTFTPVLRTSSGNPDIDNRVLEALKKWKWKPAMKDGEPVKSVKLFKFEFVVE